MLRSVNAQPQLTLVLGGARSGKSAFAQQIAQAIGGDAVLFLATWRETPETQADPEAQRRIARHRAARPATWPALVVGDDFALRWDQALARHRPRAALLDCLSLYVSGRLFMGNAPPDDPEAAAEQVSAELFAAHRRGGLPWVVVSNEVGLGTAPDHPLARAYRDALGRANQWWAARADVVWWMVAGLPLRLK